MTLTERLADWLTDGALTRARSERDAAQRAVRALTAHVGADIPISEHIDALHLLGAILARFDKPLAGGGQCVAAKVGQAVVERWREQHTEWSQRLAVELRAPSRAPRAAQEVTRG